MSSKSIGDILDAAVELVKVIVDAALSGEKNPHFLKFTFPYRYVIIYINQRGGDFMNAIVKGIAIVIKIFF